MSLNDRLSLEAKFDIIRSIGEECIHEKELERLLANKHQIICYDGFEPSGRMHIAQAQLMVHHHHQPPPLNIHQHHINANYNGLQLGSNGSQQQQQGLNGHQPHNGNYNGLQQPCPNGSQQQQQHNGNHNGLLQPRPNGSQQQQAMMHQQRNGNYNGLQLQPCSNGSQQHIINASLMLYPQ